MGEFFHKHPVARLFHEEWKFCGCGSPETVVKLVRDALAAIKARSDGEFKEDYLVPVLGPLDSPTRLFFLYWLDAVGLTEHGGSVYGSWLTDKGKQVLELLRGLGEGLDDENWSDPYLVERDEKPGLAEILSDDE
jgi:hypothetical protein